jgi:3-isopropylmalate dehydratase small subunit
VFNELLNSRFGNGKEPARRPALILVGHNFQIGSMRDSTSLALDLVVAGWTTIFSTSLRSQALRVAVSQRSQARLSSTSDRGKLSISWRSGAARS